MKIIGNTVGTPTPRTNYNQTDPKKADYLVGRENIATKAEVTAEAGRITNLEGRTTNLEGVTTNLTKAITHEPYATDEGVAYSKDVPESPMPSATLSAEVSMLGGMSRKCTNLFDKTAIVSGKGLGAHGGTYTDANICYSDAIAVKEGETYSAANVRWCNFYTDGNDPSATNFVSQNSATTLTVPSGAKYVRACVSLESLDVAMLNEGATALPYEPYFGGLASAKVTEVESVGASGTVDTLPIPEAVQALDGYGDGVNESVYNYIDFEKKQFVRRVGKVDMGTLGWGYYSPGFFSIDRTKNIENIATGNNIISDCYKTISPRLDPEMADAPDLSICSHPAGVWLSVKDTKYGNDVNALKAGVSGSMLYYELATPVITDISDILTNKVEVEGNGTLTFKNEHKIAVPRDVAYYIQVKGAALSEADKREIAAMVAEMLGSATS